MSLIMNTLIEGFDPAKIEELEKQEESSKWREIQSAYQNQTILNAKLVGFEKHELNGKKELCGIVRLDDIKGLIPIFESGYDPSKPQTIDKFQELSGKKIAFKILTYSKEENIFVASRKQAQEQIAEINLRKMKVGKKIPCVIRKVHYNHITADIGGIDVHIPVQQLTYGWIDDLRDKYKEGDHLIVQVIDIDKEHKKVKVSRKPLLKNPYSDCEKRYKKNGIYVGTITGVQDNGVYINLEEGIDAFANHLRFDRVEKGDKVLIRLTKIDIENERIRAKIIKIKEKKAI